jgi:glycosyltransferase involved in cell wall biosynthesis
VTLVVFFTRGMSLEGWRRAGIADRELALFTALRPRLERLVFVTYGGADDAAWETRLPGIEVLPNRWPLGSNVYSVLAPWLHRTRLRGVDVVRSQQINGAWTALVASWLTGSRLVVRCGYIWSDFVARIGGSTLRRTVTRALEWLVLRSADRVIVAGAADASRVGALHGVAVDRVTTIPNFVDTAAFRPIVEIPREPGRVVCVGRLRDHKNIAALIDAVALVPAATLTIVGDGPERAALEVHARERQIRCEFLGSLPNHDLPRVLNRAEIYVMPSLFEGNPKAIVEAMACGVSVIGTRVPGIEQVLTDEETGLLCGASAPELAAALQRLLGDRDLRERLAAAALTYARTHHSLAAAVEAELAVLQRVTAG